MKLNHYAYLLFFISIIFFSCEKNQDQVYQNQPITNASNDGTGSPILAGRTSTGFECPETTTELTAGQFFNSGDVTVTNDQNFIYVTYTTANGYLLTQTHLFVGGCSAIPVNNQGNPVPGQFPNKTVHNNSTTYTYQIPITSIPAGNCGCIAAHAVVIKLNELGEVIDQQTAWGKGVRINPTGNWGMKFSYCSCIL